MAEYSREQRNQLSRAVANSDTGSRQMKAFVDNRTGFTSQFKLDKMFLYRPAIQRKYYSVTNSHGETHTVYEPEDVSLELVTPFRNWKRGVASTSGHSATSALKMLSSRFNQLIRVWYKRNDKIEGYPIKFSIDDSLSGGTGVKHLKAECIEKRRHSFIWHVKVVAD